MNTQTVTHNAFFQITKEAEDLLILGTKYHYSFKLIPEFLGPISQPVFGNNGNRIYLPFTEADREIIPKLAYTMHRKVRKAGYRDIQVIIGHDLLEGDETLVSEPQVKPRVDVPQLPVVPAVQLPKVQLPEIDWGGAAKVAGAVFLGMAGLAQLSVAALLGLGSLVLVDPTYCICLDDGQGTVIELLSWDTEV